MVPVTERPSFAVGVAEADNEVGSNGLPIHTLFVEGGAEPSGGVGSVQLVREAPSSSAGLNSRLVTGKKSTAINDFRQRLKNRLVLNGDMLLLEAILLIVLLKFRALFRYQQFKKSLDDEEDSTPSESVGRGTVTSFGRVGNARSRSRCGYLASLCSFVHSAGDNLLKQAAEAALLQRRQGGGRGGGHQPDQVFWLKN